MRSSTYMQPPSATTMPLRSASKGREALVGSSCEASALRFEAGEDAERVNAFRDAAGQGDIAFAQQQHLAPWTRPALPAAQAAPMV